MTEARDEHGRKMVAAKQSRPGLGTWVFLVLSSPLLLVVFLGDILATPFVAGRHRSTAHWLLYMIARFIGPGVVIGMGVGYLVRRYA